MRAVLRSTVLALALAIPALAVAQAAGTTPATGHVATHKMAHSSHKKLHAASGRKGMRHPHPALKPVK